MGLNFTDTHCHLFSEYYDNVEEILNNAYQKNVCRFITSGCDLRGNEEVLTRLSDKNIYGVIGYHPDEALNVSEDDLKLLKKNILNDKIVGIGEIGLDYHNGKDYKKEQIELFKKQLEIASNNNLPVVIHSREATKDTIDVLKQFPNVKGVIHSFSGSIETAKIYISMGYKLGINGVVTFKNSNLKDILKTIVNDIVLETDSPYLTPHPFRGTRNEPKYISNIASFISDYIGVSMDELEVITNNNIRDIFDI